MKCKSCDRILTEKEDGAKFAESGTRVELCTSCAQWLPSDVAVVGMDIDSQLDDEAPFGREGDYWTDEE